MAKRQREWAKRARVKLILELGGKCVKCGCKVVTRLELDHILPREWDIRKKDMSHRVSIYRREAREGKLQVLCRTHNAQKGNGAFEFEKKGVRRR